MSKLIHKLLILLILPVSVAAMAADLYRWTDAEGNIMYGDSPPDNAQDLQMLESNDCKSEECLQEQELRRLEAEQRSREIQENLDKIDGQRTQELIQQAEIEKARNAATPPPARQTIIIAPDVWDGRYGERYDWRDRRWYGTPHSGHPANRAR